MKDLKVIQDNLLIPYKPGDTGELSILVVRNNEVNGRRLGVFTRFNTAVAGQRLNHADALHEPKTVTTVPQGYNSGVEVNLSAKRSYFLFGTFYISEQYFPQNNGMDWFASDVEMFNGGLKIGASAPDLTKLRTNLKTGDMSVSEASADKSKNAFCSFTLVFAGTPYHVGLDMSKHPAHITADLNARLNRIHPQLRGYVRADYSVPGPVKMEFYIAPPESLDVTIPLTTFPTKNDLSPTHDQLGVSPMSGTFHLNKALPSALLIDNTNGIRNTTNTVATVDGTAVKKNVDQLINEAFVVNLNTFTHEVATPTLYKGRVTIPASAFKTWNVDERVNFAMLKLRREYEDGRVFRLLSVRYTNSDGSATAYADQHADLFLLRAPNDTDGATTAFPSLYLNDLASADVDQLEGYRYPTSDAIKFAEAGGLNEESAMFVGLFSTPTLDNRNSIFFRNTVSATYLEIEYELVEADVIPTVKIDDLGILDYHYIKTEEHAFRPVAFSTTPVHKWNIEFITEGQEQRYQGINQGAVEGSNDIHMTTQGTVGEAVILAGIDYSKVKAPTTGEPLYFYTGEIGAETWLYQNLPYVNVVTTREVTAVKSKYKVIFPDVAMTGTLTNIEEPLIAKQSDGSLVISGRFSNETYPKNVFTHSTNTTWGFSLKGATLNPTEAITFDPLTGEFSARFAVNDLVEPGPGTHVFRVTATAKYPWLTAVNQYTQTMDILVLPAVEGIEDDVTFIGSNLFDKNVDGTESSAYRLVDLDSGEILATGANPFALRQDAITRGLVDIDLIFGQLYDDEPEISCEGAPSNVDLDIDGEWDLEIGGAIVGSGTMDELKPTALEHDVVITTECIPTPETLLRSITGELEEGSVMRLAYQVTDGNGAVKTESATYTIGETPNGESEINFGYEPLNLFTYSSGAPWNDERFFTDYANNPHYSDNWKDSCILGETRITGELWGYNLGAFTGSEPQTANLKIVIDGVEHVLTTSHLFKSAADGSEAELRALMQAFATQLEALGFTTTLVPGFTYLTGTPQEYRGTHLRIHYTVGQFNAVSVAQQLIIGNGYTPYWKEVYFDEECRVRKNGLNSASEYTALVRGQGKEDFGNGFIFDPRTVKFDTCANLNVPLEPGEIDYFLTLKVVDNESQEVSSLETPLILHSCGRNGNLG